MEKFTRTSLEIFPSALGGGGGVKCSTLYIIAHCLDQYSAVAY